MRILLLSILALLTGCSTNFSTLRPENSQKQVIYAIPEGQAFQIAFSSLAQVFPGRTITDIDGPVKGYSTTFRFVLDTYSQQVIVIPASAKNTEGNTVRGYYFDISGSGTSAQGRAKNIQLYETISSYAEATGKAIPVTDVNREPYTGAHWKQGDEGGSSQGHPSRPKDAPDPLLQIQRLKQLRDQGAITNEEFERKKKELLERI